MMRLFGSPTGVASPNAADLYWARGVRASALALIAGVLGATLPAAAQMRRPMPVVQRIEPTSGPPGTTLNLVGRFFDAEQTIWLGDAQLAIQSRLSPNRWTATIPDGARSGNLEIRTARGNVRGPRFRVTAAAPPPTIASFSPRSGAPGAEVMIRGENFSARVAENHVSLGATPVVVRSANPTELRVLVPDGAETGPFRVRVTGAGEAESDTPFAIGIGTGVTSFEPAMGPPRTRVTIRGRGFHRSRGRVRVYLGETRARVLRASETELLVEVPRRGAETGLWLVDVRGGGRAYSQTPYEVRYTPVIRSMEPEFGAPGHRITLAGEHFGTDIRRVQAVLGESTPMRVRDLADDRLVLEIPEGASNGRISVTVGGMGPTTTRAELRITRPVRVASFTPRAGGPGTEVTITGQGFSTTSEHNTVTISGQAAEVVRATETELVVRVPEARSGTLVVAVANAGESRTRQPFVITQVPTITSVSPGTGAPGSEVTITGTNFGSRAGLIRVQLGSRVMTIVRSSPTELVVRVPGSASTGRINVTVRLQGSVDSPEEFTVAP